MVEVGGAVEGVDAWVNAWKQHGDTAGAAGGDAWRGGRREAGLMSGQAGAAAVKAEPIADGEVSVAEAVVAVEWLRAPEP